MITEAIFNVLLAPLLLLVEAIPAIPFTIPSGAFNGMSSTFGALGYFLPMAALSPIIIAIFTFKIAKITMALIVRIKSFIPTMGA